MPNSYSTSDTSADRPSARTLQACCKYVAGLFRRTPTQPGAWLQEAAASLTAIMAQGTGCWIADATIESNEKRWRVSTVALDRGDFSAQARRFRLEASEGFPAEAPGCPAESRSTDYVLCLHRDAIYTPESWAVSRYRQVCAQLGFHEFVRCMHPLDQDNNRRWIIVEVHGCNELWRPTDTITSIVKAVVPGLAEAFDHHFLRRDRARAAILMRVAEPYRESVRLLAEGLSEAEIGKQIHRSTHTVHDHVKHIYRVLGVSTRLELHEVWMGERELPSASG
jgi:hypothetical protein